VNPALLCPPHIVTYYATLGPCDSLLLQYLSPVLMHPALFKPFVCTPLFPRPCISSNTLFLISYCTIHFSGSALASLATYILVIRRRQSDSIPPSFIFSTSSNNLGAIFHAHHHWHQASASSIKLPAANNCQHNDFVFPSSSHTSIHKRYFRHELLPRCLPGL